MENNCIYLGPASITLPHRLELNEAIQLSKGLLHAIKELKHGRTRKTR